jgi:hypothetical protein
MRSCRTARNSAALAAILVALSLTTSGSLAAERVGASDEIEGKLQALVDDLKARLSLPAAVVVSLVPSNALMFSVEAPTDQTKPFLLKIEADFLDELSADELEAAIAHELGHVWVFTHHPFLQTEELANQIAMRTVSRDSLERLYAKVWQRGGMKGDLARFLGDRPAAGLASDNQSR